MRRLRLHVSGTVQGVWFRESMRQEAEQLEVVGWVQNLPDGRVEAVIQGRDDRIDDMLEWVRRGPPAAQVDDVQVQPDEGTFPFTAFTVRR